MRLAVFLNVFSMYCSRVSSKSPPSPLSLSCITSPGREGGRVRDHYMHTISLYHYGT